MIGLVLAIAGPSFCSAQTTLNLGSAAQSDNLGIFEASGSLVTNGTTTIHVGTSSSKGNLGLGPNVSHSYNGTNTFSVNNLNSTAALAVTSAASQASSLTANGALHGSTISGPAGAHVVVVDLSSLNLNNRTLKIQGSASQTFIINVSGGLTTSGTSSILLSGGVTAHDVLFNVGGAISTSGTSTLHGTFLDVANSINTSGTTVVYGSLIGADAITTNGSTTVHANIFNADPTISTTPELPTIAMAGVGFLLLIGKAGFDRMRRSRAMAPAGPRP
jgi:choice-of-anchor A domain-containing protein